MNLEEMRGFENYKDREREMRGELLVTKTKRICVKVFGRKTY